MGCWHETCGVTQMPLIHGTPVALILLTNVSRIRQGENHAGHCRSNAIWTPRALPIYGKYNEYGSIEDFTMNWNTTFIVDGFREDLVEKEVGENTVHDVATKKADLNIDNLLEWIHESRVEVHVSPVLRVPENKNPIGFMMVHGEIYDMLAREAPSRFSSDPITLDAVVHDGTIMYDQMVERYATLKSRESSSTDLKYAVEMARYSARPLVDWQNHFSCLDKDGDRIDAYGISRGIRDYKDLLWDHAERGTPPRGVVPIIEEMARYIVFDTNMQFLRKSYMPQAGKGSQDMEFDLLMKLHAKADEIMRSTLKKWEGEDEEEGKGRGAEEA